MRLAAGLVAFLASACSVLYDPDRLPVGRDDAGGPGIDAGVEAFTGIEHSELVEGRGMGGSRPAVIRVLGRNLSSRTGFVLQWDDGPALNILEKEVAADGTAVVLTVGIPVDTAFASGLRRLNIAAGESTAPTLFPVDVIMLPELMLPGDVPRPGARYSRVTALSSAMFTGTEAIVIRSTSDISLEAPVSVDADRATPGAGACFTTCPGAGGPGAMNKGGGGGGFGAAGQPGASGGGAPGVMVGNGPLRPLGGLNRGQPGGTGASFGAAGAGGGSIALWADGNIGVGSDVTARGGNAPFANDTSGGGGGGSGGAILLHAGGRIDFGMNGKLKAPGGLGALTSAGNGGAGGVGRVRIDASSITGAMGWNAAVVGGVSYRGPSFSPLPPVIATSAMLSIGVAAEPRTAVTLNGSIPPATAMTDEFGEVTFAVQLARGLNRVCLSLADMADVPDIAESCVEVTLP